MAEWTASYIDNLPDASFAYVEPGGTKDGSGKTTPRSLRHFPIRDADGKPDAAHVRDALSRLPQSDFEAKARPKVEAAAKELGIGEPAQKALLDVKAEPMTGKQLDAWLAGEQPRRILMIPFGGPLPSPYSKAGVDIDREFFDAETDLYGPFDGLRASRERIVDWHHDNYGVPTDGEVGRHLAKMKGAILGRVVMDDGPSHFTAEDGSEYDGVLADWWAKAGEARMKLVRDLQRRGTALYGSSQAVFAQKADTGHIDVWPVIRHTISTSPQNTYAVVPPLKAVLTADLPFEEVGFPALKAALVGFVDSLDTELSGYSTRAATGSLTAKAGRVLSAANETALRRAIEELSGVLAKLVRDDPDLLEVIAS